MCVISGHPLHQQETGVRSKEQPPPGRGGPTGGRQITSGKPQIKKHIHLHVLRQ